MGVEDRSPEDSRIVKKGRGTKPTPHIVNIFVSIKFYLAMKERAIPVT